MRKKIKKNLGLTKEDMNLDNTEEYDEHYYLKCNDIYFVTQKEWIEHLKEHKKNERQQKNVKSNS